MRSPRLAKRPRCNRISSGLPTGRFAPSPTGPLHFGSLLAAVGSYLDARAQGGRWLVRMEDLDPPRVQPGAADDILRTLESFGFAWDGAVLYQSTRTEAYRTAFDQLCAAGLVYPCGCSRKELADSALTGQGGSRYPGTCRSGLAGRTPRAWRVRVANEVIRFTDRLQGLREQRLDQEVGDFVIRRADGPFAYQLAVVVDDAAQQVTDVVRGADLLDSTPRQIYLHRLLELPAPTYLHLPVALDCSGQKLSKQTKAAPIQTSGAVGLLWEALRLLGQNPPRELQQASIPELWAWALPNWSVESIPAVTGMPIDVVP